ncbi:MAG TPA: hypothetical protein VFU23_06780 [Gemmatimonadales bacterium]|nr:hypothetical protein [Gemmatimonadales bacterium]
MTRSAFLTITLLGLGALAGCQEELSGPADCPDLCPGNSLIIRDTVITASTGKDSSYTGYIGSDQVPALLISDGISAGEARAFATFPRRSDSVFIGGTQTLVTLDSVALTAQLIARDSTVLGLKLFFYRIPPDLDSTLTLPALDAMMTPESLIDSVLVPDTLRRGVVRMVLPSEKLSRLIGADADSGRFGLGIRLTASETTGIRIGSTFSNEGGPGYIGYGRAATTDTAQQKQTLTIPAEKSNYVIEPPDPLGNDLILGGKFGTRSIVRFDIPRYIRDSSTVLRATLELTPALPVPGLRNDPVQLQVRGVLVDLGAKSPSLSSLFAVGTVLESATTVQELEVLSIVSAWFGPDNTSPTTLFLGVSPEGGSFGRPEFISSLDPANGPRLRITYALPSRPGHP